MTAETNCGISVTSVTFLQIISPDRLKISSIYVRIVILKTVARTISVMVERSQRV